MHSTETSNMCSNIKYARVFYVFMFCSMQWEQRGNAVKEKNRKEVYFWRIRPSLGRGTLALITTQFC